MEKSERLGLSVAVVAHVALFGVLSLGIASRSELKMPVEPISVQLTDEVGLVSTAPTPTREAATATAPELAPDIEKAAAQPEPTPAPPVARPEPPAPRTVERPSPPQPKAAERPAPTPAPKPARTSPPPPAKPQPKAVEKPKPPAPANTDDRRRPDRPTPAPAPAAKPAPAQPAKAAPSPAAKAPRAPRIGSDFLEGVTDKASTSRSQTPPAATAGPAVVASLQRELLRQVKPHWVPPTGADAEDLRTKVTVRLDESGNIVGTPSAVTTGVTASNRAQEGLHKERAIAAVRRAAPFKFPPQYYSEWQTIEPTFYLGL